MKKQSKRMPWVLIVAGTLTVAVAIAWVVQGLGDSAPEQRAVAVETARPDIKPQAIDTSDALSRYISGMSSNGLTTIQERNITFTETPDWSTDRVIAIKFPLFSAKYIKGSSVEKIDGKDSYVIDILDTPKCGSSTQDDTMRLVLLVRPSQEDVLPVILRVHPNTNEATCIE